MNTQLQQIFRQAFGCDPSVVGEPQVEQFATLILQQAVDQVLRVTACPDYWLDSGNTIPVHCANSIRQHFGLES